VNRKDDPFVTSPRFSPHCIAAAIACLAATALGQAPTATEPAPVAAEAAAPTPAPLDAASAADEAMRLLEAEDIDVDARIDGIKRILAQFPENADAWAALGELLVRQGSDEQALNALKQATQRDPNLHSPWHWIGIVEKRRGNLDAAIAAFDAAMRAGGPKAIELNEKAVAQARAGRMNEAYASWQGALAADPGWGVLHANALKAAVALKDEEAARRHFEAGIAAERFEETTALMWTDWLLKGKRAKEALAAYRATLDKHADAYRVRYSYAMALKDDGKAKEAIPELRRALASARAADDLSIASAVEKSLFAIEHPDRMKDLVRAEKMIDAESQGNEPDREKLRKAIALMDPVIAENPRLWEPRLMRGVAHRRLGDAEAALADFRAVLAEAPDQPNATLNIALVHRDRGEFAEAATLARKAAETAPKDAMVAANAALVLMDANDCAGAKAVVERAGDALPVANAAEIRARIEQGCR